MKKFIKITLWILVMIMIFFFSAQGKEESNSSSNAVVLLIYRIINSIIDCQITYDSFALQYTPMIRKLAHFSEFALLGLLTYINFKDCFKKRHFSYSIVFCILYACSDELHQLFVPNRYCSIYDVGIDSLGSVLGVLFIHLILKRCSIKKQ